MGSISERPVPPTLNQLYVLHAIRDMTEIDGVAPSFRELAEELDAGVSSVHWAVQNLIDRGWLLPTPPHRHRALVLTREPPPLPEQPFEITEKAKTFLIERTSL